MNNNGRRSLPNVIGISPCADNAPGNRALMCWCPDLNLLREVCRRTNACRRCGLLVSILDIKRFKMHRCFCPIELENEFHFCYLCNGVVYTDENKVPEKAVIGLRRAVFMHQHFRNTGRTTCFARDA